MIKYIVGVVIGWFLHGHYAEQVTTLFNRVVGNF